MDDKLEKRFEQLAENRISSKNYKVFDKNSRVVKRQRINDDLCLVILNAEGEAIVLTEEFEKELFRIATIRFK